MVTKKSVIVNGRVAQYWEDVDLDENGNETTDYYQDEINGKRFDRALRRASGFRGAGLTTRGNCYGYDIGNRTMSVYGQFEIRSSGEYVEKINNLRK